MGKEIGVRSESASAFEEAKDLFAKEKYNSALERFASLVKQNPQNSEYLAWMGRIYNAKEDFTRAFEFAERAVGINDKLALGYYVRGMAYSNLKKQNEAFSDFNRAIEIDPNFANTHIWRGDIHFTRKQYKEAVSDYSKAIELDPKKMDAHLGLSKTHLELGEDRLSVKDLIHAYETNPRVLTFTEGDSLSKEVATTINKYYKEKILPQIVGSGEHLIESSISLIEWGSSSETRFRGGNSYKFIDGTRGFSFWWATDKNIYVTVFGNLSKMTIPKQGLGSFLLGGWARVFDSTKIADKDVEKRIPYSSVFQAVVESDGSTEKLKFGSTEFSFNLYSPEKMLVKIIEMGQHGKLENIIDDETNGGKESENETLALIVKLYNLRKEGVLSDQDFEKKKSELLARL